MDYSEDDYNYPSNSYPQNMGDYGNNYNYNLGNDYSYGPIQAAPQGSQPGLTLQPPQRRVDVGNDYEGEDVDENADEEENADEDESSKTGGQNNGAASGSLTEKFEEFSPTKTKDGE